MLTAKELRIIELFRKNSFASFTIREIMKKLKTKSYSWTHAAVKRLQKEKILILEKKGQSQLCTLALDGPKAVIYLALLEELSAIGQDIPYFEEILSLMPSSFHILIVAGSYADGTFTKTSDVDVVVIIDEGKEKKWLLNKLLHKGELMIPPLHPSVFTREEFLEMLTSREANYGKEIEKKHLVISGAEPYFKLLREAIQRGYRREAVSGAGRE